MVSSQSRTMEPPEQASVRQGWATVRMLYLLPLVILLADQLLKLLMTWWLGPDAGYHRWELAGHFLAFEYVENRGAAFGILPGQTTLLTAVAIVIVVACVVLMRREARTNPLAALAIGLIVGGALGNLLDRIRLGYVVDFIAVGIWPRFNLADTMITIGIGLMLWTGMRDTREGQRGPATNEDRQKDDQATIST